MIWLRVVFAGLLLCVSVLIGKAKAGRLELRSRALGDFMGFARQLEALIRVNGRTIPDALEECSRRLKDKWTGRYAAILASMYGSKAPSSGMWLAALKAVARDFEDAASLADEDAQVISLFGDQLASSDMKAIGENYAFLYSRIAENLQAADRDRAVKGRLYNTIGVLAGLAAAIVVI
jgi:stage III sporulation protein AB